MCGKLSEILESTAVAMVATLLDREDGCGAGGERVISRGVFCTLLTTDNSNIASSHEVDCLFGLKTSLVNLMGYNPLPLGWRGINLSIGGDEHLVVIDGRSRDVPTSGWLRRRFGWRAPKLTPNLL